MRNVRTISGTVVLPGILNAVVPRLPEPFQKTARRFRLRRAISYIAHAPRPLALVYTASKVASTAVTEALQAIEGQNVIQVHIISPQTIRTLGERIRQRGLITEEIQGIADLAHALYLGLIVPRHRARIVTMVREPISRNLSSYFQVLDNLWRVKDAHEKIGLDRLLDEYHDRFPHNRGIEWFDKEFKPMLGIDVYAYPFPREQGFLRMDSGPYEVLIMRHDLDNRLKEKCLAELMEVPALSIARKNVGAEKNYSEIYREFLNRVSLTGDYVDPLLNSKYARHFFDANELAQARARWLSTDRKTADGG